ncbi:GNAT family N-acetyltransferase [Actinoplanes sp. Pm04-4]|uniref:GNAT family N-acetyltransferase n=1 Tax=Paractinoplanes pyxinae TaxID=2997416 RepID=A0ABT4AYA1_9ACTN|nr:GNAT family N-acetyltransferase [Actinoplanes pyxinae]MCY1139223.1 GNAT family N-acetyltransferase [Actinoplanes pyxinae]
MEHLRRRALDYLGERGNDVDGELFVLTGPPWPRPPAGPPGVEVVLLDENAPVALIRENLDVNERGFDPSAAAVTDEQANAFRPQLAGARSVTVRLDGEPAAAGMALPVSSGVSELVGITSLVGHRRRGLGRLVTHALIEAVVGQGADLVVLSTSDGAARRLYASIGFRSVPLGVA